MIIHTTFKKIKKVVAFYHSIDPQDIGIKRRYMEVVVPRQICHYLARKYTLSTWREIGKCFGGCQHDTAISSNNSVSNRISTDKRFRQMVYEIEMYFEYDFNSMIQL